MRIFRRTLGTEGSSTGVSPSVRLMEFFARHVTRPKAHAVVYRLSRGHLGSSMPGVEPRVLLLTTTGRRSGEPRTTPLVYFRDGDMLAVAASNHGTGKVPSWLHNLRADPRVRLQIGVLETTAIAAEADGADRDRLWRLMTEQHPLFALYERRAPVPIPVVTLVPTASLPGRLV